MPIMMGMQSFAPRLNSCWVSDFMVWIGGWLKMGSLKWGAWGNGFQAAFELGGM